MVLDGAVGRAVDTEFADRSQHDVFRVDHRTEFALVDDLDRRRHLEPDLTEHERRGDVGRSHAGREGAESAVRARVRVAADDQLARRDQSLLGQYDVLDAAATDVEEVRDLLLDREVFHEFGKFRGLRVLRRNEVIFDQRDALRVEDAIGALDAAHHADRDRGRQLVGEHEVDLRVDDLSRFHAIDRRVASQDLLGKRHSHEENGYPANHSSHAARSAIRLLDPRDSRGDAAGSGDGRARRADLSNRSLRFRLDRAGGGTLRPARLRPYLQPHQQSHRRGVRGANGEPRRRLGRDCLFERVSGTTLHDSLPRAERRPSRLFAARLRRHHNPTGSHRQAHGHRDDVRAGERSRRGARGDPSEHAHGARRDDCESVGRSRRRRCARARRR